MSGKKKGKGWLMGVIVLILLGVLLFLGMKGRPNGGSESAAKSRSYQTKKSKSYQKEMEQMAKPESWEIKTDEGGLLELTARVQLPDYSRAFEDSLAEALKNSDDEAEFDEELFRLAAEAREELPYVTHELRINLSLLNEKKAKEDWTEQEIAELLAGEAFNREMQDFAMELVELYMSIGEDEESAAEAGKEDEHE